jgi:hypothetical protein
MMASKAPKRVERKHRKKCGVKKLVVYMYTLSVLENTVH